MGFLLVAFRGEPRGGVCWQGLGVAGVGGGLRVVRLWPGLRQGAGGDGAGAALQVVGGGGAECCAGRGSGRFARLCGCCVYAPCGSCGPWLAAVSRYGQEVAAWASGWGCGP